MRADVPYNRRKVPNGVMKAIKRFLTLALFFYGGLCAAQSPRPGDPCPMVHDANDNSYGLAFQRFSAELHSAIAHQDVAALGFLVEFPLTVNTNKGALVIPDAASLQGHMQMVFPEATREKILASGRDDSICRWDGYGLANGTLWLTATKGRWLISRVNVEETTRASRSPALVYSCETKTHRIVIENTLSKDFHYRSWNKPKSLSDVPDLDLSHGEQSFQGTGICAYPTYTFQRANVTIAVDGGIGCTDGSEPHKATGHLTVKIAGKVVTDIYCF